MSYSLKFFPKKHNKKVQKIISYRCHELPATFGVTITKKVNVVSWCRDGAQAQKCLH